MDEGTVNSTASDEDLMTRYMAGDERAFEIVYRRHREAVRRFLARQSGSVAVGQELGQEVWFRVIRAVQDNRYSADGRFRPYLFRIARNHLIDWYRKTGSYREVDIDDTSEADLDGGIDDSQPIRNPEQILQSQQKLQTVLSAIEELPDAQKTAILMSLESDMSYEEIAEATGTNRETVKSRLRYARQTLRQTVFTE